MAGRIAIPADYAALDALYRATSAPNIDLYWPKGAEGASAAPKNPDGSYVVPEWARYKVYVSTDGSGIRLAIATQRKPFTLTLPGIEIVLHDELRYYAGPRASLTQTQANTAIRECQQVRLSAMIADGRGSENAWGIVPSAWPLKLKTFYANSWPGLTATIVPVGYWPRGENAEWVIFWGAAGAMRAAI